MQGSENLILGSTPTYLAWDSVFDIVVL